MTVEQFFTQYAALSMGEDERALADAYAPNFFVAGPKGSMTFANDAAFLDYLVRVRGFNREHARPLEYLPFVPIAAHVFQFGSELHCAKQYRYPRSSTVILTELS